jgi:hypothetical protein
MFIQPFQVVQGNYGQQLFFVIVDAQGEVLDLSGAALTFKAQDANDPTGTNLILTGTMAVDDAALGMCHYTVGTGDFSYPGTFRAQLDIVQTDFSRISVPNLTVIVIPGLPLANN